MSKLPTFDRDADGNPFDWIVKTAKRVRAERQGVNIAARAVRRAMRREEGRAFDAMLEAEEAERFVELRTKFPRRSKLPDR